MLSFTMTCRLPLRPHPRPALTPVLSITSTLPFSVDLQPIQSKRLAHSFKNIGGYTPIVPKSGRRETGAAGSSTCGEVSESRAKEVGRSGETAASIRWLRLRLSSVA